MLALKLSVFLVITSGTCGNLEEAPEINFRSGPDTACLTLPKQGNCPTTLLTHGKTKICKENSDCPGNQLCCKSSINENKVCSFPESTKPGVCPTNPRRLLEGNFIGDKCNLDPDCKGNRKCCPVTSCHSYCSEPIFELKEKSVKSLLDVISYIPETKDISPCKSIVKVGECPLHLINTDSTSCNRHDECLGNRLCCDNGLGENQCSDPKSDRKGICPPLGRLIEKSVDQCQIDANCSINKKCCPESPCSYHCSSVIQWKRKKSFVRVKKDDRSSCFTIPKYGLCPDPLINTGKSICHDNENCYGNKICCKNTNGISVCSDPVVEKSGKCPSPGKLINKGNKCYVDGNCGENRKCCEETPCLYLCSDAVDLRIPQTRKLMSFLEERPKFPISILEKKPYIDINVDERSACPQRPKYGVCPATLIKPGRSICFVNENCDKNRLCCPDGTGNKKCSDPRDFKNTGDCPKPDNVTVAKSQCYVNENCNGERKCCEGPSCAFYCSNVIKNCIAIPKYGQCPEPYALSNVGIDCSNSEECPGNQVCCNDTANVSKCSDPKQRIPGICPNSANLINPGKSACYVDENCGYNRRCCEKTPCLYQCSDVIRDPSDIACYSIAKFGECPKNLIKPGKNICFVDENCAGNRRCCRDGMMGYRCSDPERVKPGVCPMGNALLNPGTSICYVDANCGQGRLCCKKTGCEYRCSDPDPNVTILSTSSTTLTSIETTATTEITDKTPTSILTETPATSSETTVTESISIVTASDTVVTSPETTSTESISIVTASDTVVTSPERTPTESIATISAKETAETSSESETLSSVENTLTTFSPPATDLNFTVPPDPNPTTVNMSGIPSTDLPPSPPPTGWSNITDNSSDSLNITIPPTTMHPTNN